MMPAVKYDNERKGVVSSQGPGRKGILLVDSEESHRTTLGSLLKEEGHSVTSCGTLFDAIVIIQIQPFDFVITDHSSSGVNGLHVLERVKQYNAKTPVLLISTLYEVEPYLAAMNMGALDYLRKPADYLEVQRLVRSH
jgi:DNA-binding NtrC family response regulator